MYFILKRSANVNTSINKTTLNFTTENSFQTINVNGMPQAARINISNQISIFDLYTCFIVYRLSFNVNIRACRTYRKRKTRQLGYKIYSAKLPLFPQSLKLQRFIVQPMISVRNLRYDREIYDCKQKSRHRFFCNFVVNFSSPIATYGFAAASKHLIINRLKMAKS